MKRANPKYPKAEDWFTEEQKEFVLSKLFDQLEFFGYFRKNDEVGKETNLQGAWLFGVSLQREDDARRAHSFGHPTTCTFHLNRQRVDLGLMLQYSIEEIVVVGHG